jgi:cytoskeletal protein RodZ
MSTVSEELQRARLNQGIDLATVAARTRIKTKYLQAIEVDDRKSLPGRFFYKSFVHQYATFLGVDTIPIDAEVDRVLSADAPVSLPMVARQRDVKGITWNYLSYGALVLILLACWGLDNWWHENQAPLEKKVMHQEASSPPAERGSLTPVANTPAAAKQNDAPVSPKVELALTATEETWLSVSSDGTPVFSGLLEANQTKTIEGNDAKLRVGNAAGLEVRLNGKPLGPLGAHGQVRDLDFTSGKFSSAAPQSERE